MTTDTARDDAPLFEEPPIQPYPMTVVTIGAVSPEGYPITITLNDPAQGAMTNWIKLLASKGFTPPSSNPTPAAGAPQMTMATGDAPVCPIHAPRKMKASNYGGWFCTWSDPTTGEKCKEKVKG